MRMLPTLSEDPQCTIGVKVRAEPNPLMVLGFHGQVGTPWTSSRSRMSAAIVSSIPYELLTLARLASTLYSSTSRNGSMNPRADAVSIRYVSFVARHMASPVEVSETMMSVSPVAAPKK